MASISKNALFVLAALFVSFHVANAATLTYTKAFSSFYAGVLGTPDATMCRSVIEALNLKATMSNPALKLTVLVPTDAAFKAMASKLGVTDAAMSKNAGLMRQVMYYHFVTGSNGAARTFHSTQLTTGLKLDTMYVSPTTKKPYQLVVASATPTTVTTKVNGTTVTRPGSPQVLIKSMGTSAYIVRPNVKCGAGVAHVINNVLSPMTMAAAAKLG